MNFNSADWKELEEGVRTHLVELDKRNRKNLSPEDTQYLRGEIRALLWILDWNSRTSPPDVASYEIT